MPGSKDDLWNEEARAQTAPLDIHYTTAIKDHCSANVLCCVLKDEFSKNIRGCKKISMPSTKLTYSWLNKWHRIVVICQSIEQFTTSSLPLMFSWTFVLTALCPPDLVPEYINQNVCAEDLLTSWKMSGQLLVPGHPLAVPQTVQRWPLYRLFLLQPAPVPWRSTSFSYPKG